MPYDDELDRAWAAIEHTNGPWRVKIPWSVLKCAPPPIPNANVCAALQPDCMVPIKRAPCRWCKGTGQVPKSLLGTGPLDLIPCTECQPAPLSQLDGCTLLINGQRVYLAGYTTTPSQTLSVGGIACRACGWTMHTDMVAAALSAYLSLNPNTPLDKLMEQAIYHKCLPF